MKNAPLHDILDIEMDISTKNSLNLLRFLGQDSQSHLKSSGFWNILLVEIPHPDRV